jgi:hypothetical protein
MQDQVWAKVNPRSGLDQIDKEGDKLCLCLIFYVEIVEK